MPPTAVALKSGAVSPILSLLVISYQAKMSRLPALGNWVSDATTDLAARKPFPVRDALPVWRALFPLTLLVGVRLIKFDRHRPGSAARSPNGNRQKRETRRPDQ